MTTERYMVMYTDGRVVSGLQSYEEACEEVRQEAPSGQRAAGTSRMVIGHSGDLEDGGDRTLCWMDTQLAENDDGAKAVAEITRADR